jgi:hypothetical protein
MRTEVQRIADAAEPISSPPHISEVTSASTLLRNRTTVDAEMELLEKRNSTSIDRFKDYAPYIAYMHKTSTTNSLHPLAPAME